jgi:methionyl-tRNA formyltransferase
MAVPPLEALHAAGFDIALVVTRPDKRRGRGGATTPSPVKAAALRLGLAVTHDVDDVLDAGADLGVVVAYGRLVKPHVLERLPMVNLHFSLLPRWRGAAPVERALLAGDETTGVCVMAVDETLDTGDVYARAEVPIGPATTAEDLRRTLVAAGTDLLVRTLAEGLGDPWPQEGEPTYAAKVEPSELAIDWDRPAVEVDRLVRLGGAWTTWRGRRLKVWRLDPVPADEGAEPVGPVPPGTLVAPVAVMAGDGPVRLGEVQPEGRARQAAADWWRGARPEPGERFTP